MFEKLRGNFLASTPRGIIIDVHGVGYGLEVPLNVMASLPNIGDEVDFWIHTYVREDAIKLFGFQSYVERVAFEILIGLNGVGPKVALAILSTLSVEQLKKAVLLERLDILQNVPGIGKRLAEKIFVELKPKLKKLNAAGFHKDLLPVEGTREVSDLGFSDLEDGEDANWAVVEDVKSALENLGFKDKAISNVMDELSKETNEWEFQNLMRESLAKLGSYKIEGSSRKSQTLDKLF